MEGGGKVGGRWGEGGGKGVIRVELPSDVHDILNELVKIHRQIPDHQPSLLHLGSIKHVVDQLQETLARHLYCLDGELSTIREETDCTGKEALGEADDAVEGVRSS